MSLLKKYFDKLNTGSSPVIPDFERVVNYDDTGAEVITFEKVDYPSRVAALGTVDLWSLNAMLSAGISPDTGIHTGFNTRLDGLGAVGVAVKQMNDFLDSQESNSQESNSQETNNE